MKKIIASLTLVLLLGIAAPALAVEAPKATTSARPTLKAEKNEIRTEIKDLRVNIKEQKQEIKSDIKELKTNTKEQKQTFLTEIKKKRVEGVYKGMRNELTQRYAALQKTKAKIQARIAEKEAAGKDTTAVKAKLATITQYETAYTTDLSNLDLKYQQTVTSKNPSELVAVLKPLAKKVATDLTSIRTGLIDTLKLLVKQ